MMLEKLFQAPRMTGGGLHRAQALAQALGFPHRSFPCIHVAGSNGKGSVCFKIAAALEASGYRVGLYTSPHLISFNERIQVNRKPIDQVSLEQGLELLFSIDKQLNLEATFFELSTILGLHYFQQCQVDIAVIETGLGGRLDATNIIDPLLTVITSISLEHTQLLGADLESIAREKAGILKPGIPCIIGPFARYLAIEERAKALNCPLIFAEEAGSFFDEENRVIARQALKHLSISEESMEEGLSKRPPCRFEKRGDVIIDVAHNPDAFSHLVQALEHFFPNRKKRFLLGLCADKDVGGCLKHLLPIATHIHLVQAPLFRAASLELLAKHLEQEGFYPFSSHPTIANGIDEALCSASAAQELLIICGSFYIIEGVAKLIDLSEQSSFATSSTQNCGERREQDFFLLHR